MGFISFNPGRGWSYCDQLHFLDENSEAQKDEITCQTRNDSQQGRVGIKTWVDGTQREGMSTPICYFCLVTTLFYSSPVLFCSFFCFVFFFARLGMQRLNCLVNYFYVSDDKIFFILHFCLGLGCRDYILGTQTV